jgi:flagellar motility protein MotE (MotC chaperone)
MDSQVRLLPAVIGAAAVLVALRLGAMSFGGDGNVAAAAEHGSTLAPAAAEAPAAAAPPVSPPAATADDAKPPAPPADSGQPQNKGEADVMRGLSERRGALDARENELLLREQLLAATQKQVDEKIAQLKEIQSKLDIMLAQRDDAQKAQLGALVKMYENMKPGDAAKIFEQLDKRILAEVAGGMKPAKVGAVLAAMDTAKAHELTALLANRLILPPPQIAAAPLPAPVLPEAAAPALVEAPALPPVAPPPATPTAEAPPPAAPPAAALTPPPA